jgi:ubiquinone/menaquinone biosynthesis C-methylase UbiE
MAHGRRRFAYDDPERKKLFDPEAVLALAGLGPGMTFVDIGCGEGFFAIPAAKMVGNGGRVIALDIDAESVERLRETAGRLGLAHVSAFAAPAEEAIPCEGCADVVFFGTVLHDFADPDKVLKNARSVLGPAGTLFNLDWRKEPMEIGPPLGIRFDEAKASRLNAAAGFRIEAVTAWEPYHYIITAKPV